MKNTILFASLTLTLALGLAHAPALRADESDYSPQVYDEDEAKEERSLLRPYLEPAHIPTPEYLASCKGVGGQGFAVPPDAASRGHGLANMKHRLAAVDGRCEVRSQPGGGTCVRFDVPLATRH